MRFSSLSIKNAVTYFLFLCLLLSCSTVSEPFAVSGSWQQEGLAQAELKVLGYQEGVLFAGGRQGIFKKAATALNTTWTPLGFEEASTEVRDFVIISKKNIKITVFNFESFNDSSTPTFYESQDGGATWIPVETTLEGRDDLIKISYLEHVSQHPETFYAYNSSVIRSQDGGLSWYSLHTGGVSYFLTVSPYHPDVIITGGVNTIFSPYLAKSEDGGETWTSLSSNIYNNADAVCYDALLHPDTSQKILVVVGGGIRKSTNGGEIWKTVFRKASIYTLAHSAPNPSIIYAAGETPEGTLAFFASNDFGDSWQQVEMPDSPRGIHVNDMVSVMEGGHEVLYLGTNKGMYSYRFKN